MLTVRALLFHEVPFLIAEASVDVRRYKKSIKNNLAKISCILNVLTKCYRCFVLYVDVLINCFKSFSKLSVTTGSECFIKALLSLFLHL